MPLSVRQIHPVFVGEVSGVDLTKPLSKDDVAILQRAIDQYAVLVFHDQQITDAQQQAFTLNFGALENARGARG